MNNLRGINRIGDDIADKPRLFAVASGKGGVGKSVISYNLAHQLSRTGRVLLVDGDFQMGNLHLLANMAPACGWQDVCREQAELLEAIQPINDNFDFLASIGGRADELLPDMQSLALCLGSLRDHTRDYDFVLIDTASGILPHTSLILNAVDEVILVTTPELTSISDCYALYKVLISNNKHLTASLLVNREDQKENVEYIYQKFIAISDQFLGRSPVFLGSLGEDSILVDSVARQQGVAEISPNSLINKQFAVLAESLTGSRQEAGFDWETTNFKPAGADIKE